MYSNHNLLMDKFSIQIPCFCFYLLQCPISIELTID